MNMKNLLQINPDKFIKLIIDGLGNKRYNALKQDEDKYQIFWLGVIEATNKIKSNDKQIGYLILKGYGNIKNWVKSNHSRNIIKYCPECGSTYGFRKIGSCKCGEFDLKISNRFKALTDIYIYRDEDKTLSIAIEQFIETLIGNIKYVAKRWLIDRVDLLYDNYSKQLASELEVSPPMISKYIRKIKQKFIKWYEEN